MHRLTSFYASIDWTDPRIISAVALIWFAAVGYLIFWIIDDRHRAPETDDEEEREQQPETDETQTDRFWARVRDRFIGERFEGVPATSPALASIMPARGYLTEVPELDSVEDRAEWHDEL